MRIKTGNMNVSDLVLITTAAGTILYYILVHIPAEQRKRFDMKLGEIHSIYGIMNRVLNNTSAERFLIWKSQNGNGIPRFGFQLYLSVLYEDYLQPFKSVKTKYYRLKADSQYVNMLKTVYDSGEVAFFTADMPDGLLKDMYINEGVYWSYVFRIGQKGAAFYYGSISTSQPVTPFEADSGVNTSEIRLAVNDLREKYNKLNHNAFQRIKETLYL